MDKTPRLVKISRILNGLLVATGILMISAAILRWFVFENPNLFPPTIVSYITPGALTPSVRILGFLVELIPVSVALIALVSLYRICASYSKGEMFSQAMGRHYRSFGKGLVLLSVAYGLHTGLLSALLSASSAKKELAVSLGLSTADVFLLMLGILFVILGTVMDEAYRIHVENKQII